MGYQDGPMSVAPKAITWDVAALPPPVTPLPPNEDPADHSKYDYERSALPTAASLVPFFSTAKALLTGGGGTYGPIVFIPANGVYPTIPSIQPIAPVIQPAGEGTKGADILTPTPPPQGTLPKLSSVSVSSSSDRKWTTLAEYGAAAAVGAATLLKGFDVDIRLSATAALLFGPVEQYQNMLTNPDNVPDGM